MLQKTIYLTIFILSFLNLKGQKNISYYNLNSKQIQKQENVLTRKFKKTKCYNSKDSLNYLFIYLLNFKHRPSQKLIVDKNIMCELTFSYHKKSNFPFCLSVIYNQNNKVVANGERKNIYCYENMKFAQKKDSLLLEYKLQFNPEIMFQISPASPDLFFAKRKECIKALLIKESILKELSMDEFVEHYWSVYFPEDVLELYNEN